MLGQVVEREAEGLCAGLRLFLPSVQFAGFEQSRSSQLHQE